MAKETAKSKEQNTAGLPSFEENMDRLQKIVEMLEQGEISLSDSVKLYKEGLELSTKCKEEIEKAKHEVKILQNDTPEPFDAAANRNPAAYSDSGEISF